MPFDQVDPGDLLGNRVFDLQPRVHFHEPDAVGTQAFTGVGDELDRAGADVIDRPGRLHRRCAQRRARAFVHAGGGGFLDDLLVAALQRAIALEQVDDIAVAVAEHLHLDMARALDVFLDQDMGIAEAGRCLALARGERVDEVRWLFDQPHALAAAAGHRLDQHRIADLGGLAGQVFRLLVFAHVARRDRHAGCRHQRLGRVLQPHRGDRGRARADPDQPGIEHGLGEPGVFRKEPVAGVDRLGAAGAGGSDDAFANEIAFACRRWTDVDGLVGLADVQRVCVGVGIDRDGADAQPPRGADDPAGDFAAICNE